MDSVIFSKSELEQLTAKQLNVLLSYYGLPNPKLKKDKVDILEKFYRPVVQSNDVEMSVRIKRIKEVDNVW